MHQPKSLKISQRRTSFEQGNLSNEFENYDIRRSIMTPRVAILGASGQVGKALQAGFSQRNPIQPVLALGRDYDVTDSSSWRARLDAFEPDVIINAAAFTAVDACEREPDRAFAVNRDAVAALAQWCANSDKALIHISTDYVFGDSGSAPITEDAPVSPLNIYGASKEAGESILRTILPRHMIARTSWVYGPDAGNFFATIMRLAETRDQIKVVADEISCPTFVSDLAEALIRLSDRVGPDSADFGTIHCAGEQGLSRFDFARAIMAARAELGLKTAEIAPTTQALFGAPARRPCDSRLDSSFLERAYGIKLPGLSARLPHLVSVLARQN